MLTFAVIGIGIILLAFVLTHPLSSRPPEEPPVDFTADPKL